MSSYQTKLVGLTLATALAALAGQAAALAAPAVAASDNPDVALPPAELQNLVAPIALYPDVLIAQILPAATFPTDIVMAARWLRSAKNLDQLDQKPWDESVKALCHYPDVLFKMDEDLEWTNALGAAFLNQHADVMNAVQQARQQAQAQGLLETNQQQTVVDDDDAIRVVPTQADVVYVPQYDPQIIYSGDGGSVDYGSAVAAPAITYGAGLALGNWLNMDCNWAGHGVYYCQPGYWRGWPHYGAGHWGGDWVAGVGPRGAFAAGADRGYYAGPHAAAAWGEHGGLAWDRPPTTSPRPTYTGRYSGYNNNYGRVGNTYGQANRNLALGAKNNVDVNRNNVNIDRGDRDAAYSGARAAKSTSALADAASRSEAQRFSDRGRESRQASDLGEVHRATPAAAAGGRASEGGARPSSPRESSMGDARSRPEVQQAANRGAASRGGPAGGAGRRR